jgi:hypothetical protein
MPIERRLRQRVRCDQGFIMQDRPTTDPIKARSASKEGVVRYVLGISLALVVVLFVASYLIR